MGPVLSVTAGVSIWVLGGGFVFIWAWFFLGGIRVLAGGIGPGVPHIMDVAAPGAYDIASSGGWVLKVCLVVGVGGIEGG